MFYAEVMRRSMLPLSAEQAMSPAASAAAPPRKAATTTAMAAQIPRPYQVKLASKT
jgi:hypothetical protein